MSLSFSQTATCISQEASPTGSLDQWAFGNLINNWLSHNRIWLEPKGDNVWLCNVTDDGFYLQRDAATQSGILVVIDLIRLAAGPDWWPRFVILEMKPSSAHTSIEVLSEAEVRFHPKINVVAFPAEFLAQPIKYHGRHLTKGIVPDPNPEGFVPSLSALLRNQIAYGEVPGLDMAAHTIGMNSRSLQGRLHEAGLSFRHLMDRLNFEFACKLLGDPTVTVRDLAATLGSSKPLARQGFAQHMA